MEILSRIPRRDIAESCLRVRERLVEIVDADRDRVRHRRGNHEVIGDRVVIDMKRRDFKIPGVHIRLAHWSGLASLPEKCAT